MSTSPHVLIVDDEPLVRRALSRLLSRRYQIVQAASAAEALDRLRDGPRFDAVVSDVAMPGMSGFDLFKTIQRDDPQLARRFVFITGASLDVEMDIIRREAVPILKKPMSPHDLFRTVEQVIASGRARPAKSRCTDDESSP